MWRDRSSGSSPKSILFQNEIRKSSYVLLVFHHNGNRTSNRQIDGIRSLLENFGKDTIVLGFKIHGGFVRFNAAEDRSSGKSFSFGNYPLGNGSTFHGWAKRWEREESIHGIILGH
jgi:hypothetical protein